MANLTRVFWGLCLLFSLPAVAQVNGGMSEESMQQMMQGMMGMANCMQNIDQGELQALAEESKAKEKEIKQLCANGERDKAQQEAITFGLKYMQSDTFKQMKQCGEMAKGMMPEVPDYSAYSTGDGDGGKPRHVCDDM